MTTAPNRNPCESSFRMIDKRITIAQRNAMSDLDLYAGISEYWVLEDGNVECYVFDMYYCTFKRDGTMTIVYNNLS